MKKYDQTHLIPETLQEQIKELTDVEEFTLTSNCELCYLEKGEERNTVWFVLRTNTDEVLGKFALITLPGCCGICVSTGAYITLPWRNKGLGTLMNNVRIAMAETLGYGLLLATSQVANKPQQKIFEKNGWECAGEFTNPRTENILRLHTYNLEY